MLDTKSEGLQFTEEEFVNTTQPTTSGRPTIQPEKKMKRSENGQEEEEDESIEEDNEIDIKNREKVFIKTKTGKRHYFEIIKSTQYIKGMPTSVLAAMMTEWTLSCKIKRRSSKNINSTISRKMRECLIHLYHTLEEIRNEDRIISVEKEFERVTSQLGELKEENQKLREELENIKRSMKTPRIIRDQKSTFTQTSNKKEVEIAGINMNKSDKTQEKKSKSVDRSKKNLQPEIISLDKKGKEKKGNSAIHWKIGKINLK